MKSKNILVLRIISALLLISVMVIIFIFSSENAAILDLCRENDIVSVVSPFLRRGQGTRPRPVGDTGSVSWRSGQNCAK